MPTVTSVQRFSIPLAASQLFNSATLAVGTVVANCVPFINGRVVTPSASQRWLYNNVDVYFSADTVVVATSAADVRELMVEVTVVEFDPTAVKVQQIPYTILDTILSTTAVIPAAVVLANTFVVHAWQKTSTSRNNSDTAILALFSSNIQLTLDRYTGNGDINGNAYVVEALVGAFTVQTITSIVAGASQTDTIPVAVTDNKTLVVASYKANGGTGPAGDLVPYIQLVPPTGLLLSRNSTSGTVEATSFIISFAAGGAEVVKRGLLTQTVVGGTPSEDVTLSPPVDLTRAMAWITASMSFRCGRTGGATTNAIPDSRVGITFFSNTVLRFQRNTFDATPLIGTDNVYSWEVIEWDTGAAAPVVRRVMVSS